MKTCIVTGGAGLIGSHLVKRLLEEGNKVIVIDDLSRGNIRNIPGEYRLPFYRIDLTKQEECKNFLKTMDLLDEKIDEFYHLAAFLGGVEFIHKYPVEAYCKNLEMNINALKLAYYLKTRFLFTSTACVYPVFKQDKPDSLPLKEEDVTPYEPESGYGWAKLITEFICKSYSSEYGMPIGIVRMFNVYGPGEKYAKGSGSHVIPIFCREAITGEPITVYGDGTQTRSFIYVEDAVDGIIKTCRHGCNLGPINIGTEERYSINELAEIVKTAAKLELGKNIEIVYSPEKPVGVVGRSANCFKANASLNWYPTVPLLEGVLKTMKWMRRDIEST